MTKAKKARKHKVERCEVCGTNMIFKRVHLNSHHNALAWLGASAIEGTRYYFVGQFCEHGCQRYYGAVKTLTTKDTVREYQGTKIKGFGVPG